MAAVQNSNDSLTWRQLLAPLGNVKRMLQMVWATSPGLTSLTVVLCLTRAILPLALLWVPKLILDNLVGLWSNTITNVAPLWHLVIIEFLLAALSDILGRAYSLCESLLGDLFTNNISLRLIEHAATLDLSTFENPLFHDKLERARNQTVARLSLLAALMNLAQEVITLISLSASLFIFSPWLLCFLIVAATPVLMSDTHFSTLAYSALYRWTPWRRQLDYLRFLGASSQTAKEIKVF